MKIYKVSIIQQIFIQVGALFESIHQDARTDHTICLREGSSPSTVESSSDDVSVKMKVLEKFEKAFG